MKIELKNNILELMTYDGKNYSTIIEENIEGENLYVVVDSDIITKLINKSTSEFTTLELVNNSLKVTTNGTYIIEIPTEDGIMIKYPEPQFDFNNTKNISVDTQKLKNLFESNKPSLSQTTDMISMMGYYIDEESILTTDSFVVTNNQINLTETPKLLTPEFVNLISLINSDKLTIYYGDTNIAVVGGNTTIIGRYQDGIDTYPVSNVKELIKVNFSSMCKVPRLALIDILDRMSLFVSEYDKNSIQLSFNEGSLTVKTKKTNGEETLIYTEKENINNFICSVDVEMLKSQLQVQSSELAEIWFGNDSVLKMVDKTTTQLIATVINEN